MSSRIAGGSLLKSLRSLRARAGRFLEHRASPDDRLWVGPFFDELGETFDRAVKFDSARASLCACDRRRRAASKTADRVTTAAGVLSDAG